ncbi:MAG: S1 family peptidase [Roseicyclus sp.]|jgi:V8-like Glu-specific endopeptidase|nr:S1 family peptidase [Roseicyclus sp.]
MRLFRLILCLVLMPCAATAQGRLPQMTAEAPLRALTTPAEAGGWAAVGRLDAPGSFCSATLVAPDLVMTAAHCLFDAEHRRIDDRALRFAAGLRNGHAEAVRGVARSFLPPDWHMTGGRPDTATVARDIALLELDAPILLAAVRPIPAGSRGHEGDLVTIISYGRDRAFHASIEENCRILDREGDVTALSCSVVEGSSGSPVLRRTPSGLEIAAVVSALGERGGQTVSFAVDAAALLPTLLAARDAARPGGGAANVTVRRATDTSGGRDRIGARFLRP